MLAASPPGAKFKGVQSCVSVLRCYDGKKLAFVGDMKRIEAEQFACSADCVANGDRFFKDVNPQGAIASQFVERSGNTSASRVTHPTDAGAAAAAMASTRENTERVSERKSASKSKSPRASRMVMP